MLKTDLSRRGLLKSSGAAFAAALLPMGLGNPAMAQAKVTIGVVYVGPRDDFGWNQGHAFAMDVLKAVPGVTVVEEENVPETDACSTSMESMITVQKTFLTSTLFHVSKKVFSLPTPRVMKQFTMHTPIFL
jgi:simple sugar transport system substrate-binding protein